MTFGATIKELRKQHRMTQRELAERLRARREDMAQKILDTELSVK